MVIGVSFQDVYIIAHQKFVSVIITSVQNPPNGPFNSKDLIWHVFKGVSGQKGGAIWKVQIAYISNQWVQDFMDGREQQENAPSKFTRRKFKANSHGSLKSSRMNNFLEFSR